ncbi:hypothetical protein GCM10028787_18680 [Brachybacterium horti]
MPGPSSAAAEDEVVRGREAAAGPRWRSLVVPAEEERPDAREPRADGPAPGAPPARRPPDAGTGRLADRGAPGRFEVMPEGYRLDLRVQPFAGVKRGKAAAPA